MSVDCSYAGAPAQVDAFVVIAHPDDEVCLFGGLIPQLVDAGKTLLVIAMTSGGKGADALVREKELADSLHVCGVPGPPVLCRFRDCGFIAPGRFETVEWVWKQWGGRSAARDVILRLYRRFHPSVIFTHNHVTGDYGHPNHMACGAACVDAFDVLAGEEVPPSLCILQASARLAAIAPDWDRPLRHFQGRSGWEVANAALACHRSQFASHIPLHRGQRLETIRSSGQAVAEWSDLAALGERQHHQ